MMWDDVGYRGIVWGVWNNVGYMRYRVMRLEALCRMNGFI